ncbi:MAG TPA: hypothetical protein VM182_13235 [Terriglobia bacterium]|nr:hypothetical protein [Terriglobia bacterium]
MNNMILLEIVGVLAAWTVAGYAIWRWGPGTRRRSVRCPEKKIRAVVMANQSEAEFGCLRVTDISACSLLPGAPVTCDKECLVRL